MPIKFFEVPAIEPIVQCTHNRLLEQWTHFERVIKEDLVSYLKINAINKCDLLSIFQFRWLSWLKKIKINYKEISRILFKEKVIPEELNKRNLIFNQSTVKLISLVIKDCLRVTKGVLFISRTFERTSVSKRNLVNILENRPHLLKLVLEYHTIQENIWVNKIKSSKGQLHIFYKETDR